MTRKKIKPGLYVCKFIGKPASLADNLSFSATAKALHSSRWQASISPCDWLLPYSCTTRSLYQAVRNVQLYADDCITKNLILRTPTTLNPISQYVCTVSFPYAPSIDIFSLDPSNPELVTAEIYAAIFPYLKKIS